MISLSDQQYRDFQSLLDWKTGIRLPDGRVLGVPRKGTFIVERQDHRVALLAERFQTAEKSVLELGCLEGSHTVQLARVCREVTAVDVRPKNIVCTLTQLFVHGIRNVEVKLADAEQFDESLGRFDVIFHVGVLYHLVDPVAHLFRIARMADDLLLDTHVCLDDTRFKPADLCQDGRTYRAYWYKEHGWRDVFSGIAPRSRWLHRDALLESLRDAGYQEIEVIETRLERNGPRVCVLARR
jgi:SAM-dependent methyltransferase